MADIGRLLTAMCTPFTEEGRVDFDAAQPLARLLVAAGPDGVVVAGTTGGSPTLTDEAKIDQLRAVNEAMPARSAGAPAGFRVWSGDDGVTLPLLAVGGYGVICVTSHLAGRAVKTMIEAYGDGRNGQATEVHHRLLPLINALMTAASNPIPVKTALNRLGFPAGPFRLPLTLMDDATTAKVMKAVEGAGDLVTFQQRVEVA